MGVLDVVVGLVVGVGVVEWRRLSLGTDVLTVILEAAMRVAATAAVTGSLAFLRVPNKPDRLAEVVIEKQWRRFREEIQLDGLVEMLLPPFIFPHAKRFTAIPSLLFFPVTSLFSFSATGSAASNFPLPPLAGEKNGAE